MIATDDSSNQPTCEPPTGACGRRTALLVVVIVAVFAGSGWLKSRLADARAVPACPADCRRIIAAAPSVTETLFALGLGDRVVGVSRYCNYPPEACDRPRVGGMFDPNIEAICALRPDLIIMPKSTEGLADDFRKLGLATLVVDHRDLEGVFESIETIGRVCRVEKTASDMVGRLRSRLARVTEKSAGLARPRVLISFDRIPGQGHLEDFYVVGSSPQFNSILKWAGGRNVFEKTPEAFFVVSREAFFKANPEVIIDLIPAARVPRGGTDACLQDWDELVGIDAIEKGRIHVLTEDYALVPGPRFILLVEKLARLLHPEVDWEEEVRSVK
ncbi:MAG: ABC transporter substrate-binding protein [Pirellulales bacterium]|nr:ABC transporter substrate-binding protein [Pirellulales bacterium]